MKEGRFLDFVNLAIDKEVEASALYERYAGIVTSQSARKLLEDMAAIEKGHEAKLRSFMKSGTAYFSKIGVIGDLHISDFMTQPVLTADSPPADVFQFAMKEEQKAHDLYSRLGALETDGQVKQLFRALADEEKKHKHDLENEYEKNFIQEN